MSCTVKAADAAHGTAARSQVEIGQMLGISAARVNQIEQAARAKLKRAIEREAASRGLTVRQWLLES